MERRHTMLEHWSQAWMAILLFRIIGPVVSVHALLRDSKQWESLSTSTSTSTSTLAAAQQFGNNDSMIQSSAGTAEYGTFEIYGILEQVIIMQVKVRS
jgi:hypothetical protein